MIIRDIYNWFIDDEVNYITFLIFLIYIIIILIWYYFTFIFQITTTINNSKISIYDNCVTNISNSMITQFKFINHQLLISMIDNFDIDIKILSTLMYYVFIGERTYLSKYFDNTYFYTLYENPLITCYLYQKTLFIICNQISTLSELQSISIKEDNIPIYIYNIYEVFYKDLLIYLQKQTYNQVYLIGYGDGCLLIKKMYDHLFKSFDKILVIMFGQPSISNNKNFFNNIKFYNYTSYQDPYKNVWNFNYGFGIDSCNEYKFSTCNEDYHSLIYYSEYFN